MQVNATKLFALHIAPIPAGAWSMIRKSGNRFSDKIMLHQKKTRAQSIQLETIALWSTRKNAGERLFAGLHQRAVAAGALKKLEEAERAEGKEDGVEPKRVKHQIRTESVVDEQRTHAFEHVGRRQRTGHPRSAA